MVANSSADVGSFLLASAKSYIASGIGSTVAYLHPILSEPSMIYFKQPPSAYLKNSMLQPFSVNLWLALIIFFLLMAVILQANINAPNCIRARKVNCGTISTGLIYLVIKAVELLLAKNSDKIENCSSYAILGRLAVTFGSVCISSIYTAKVVLIFVLKDNIIKTPEDLVSQNYKMYTYDTLHVNRLFVVQRSIDIYSKNFNIKL